MKVEKIDRFSHINLSQYLDRSADPINLNIPLPFEDFYLPYVRDSSQKLQLLLSDRQSNLLSRVAYQSLERDLLVRMVALGTKTLSTEFDRYRESHSNLDKTAILASQDRAMYDQFIANLLSVETDLFEKYPVLDLLLTTTSDLWIKSTQEFIDRLDADISLLAQTFANGSNLGQLQEIETALGARHHDGRSVFALKFASGVEVIYKPKNLGLDVAFNELSIWCNRQGISLPFRSLKIINRQEYGWQEAIEQQPCLDRSAVQNFYHRSGMMLSLLYILGAKDCEHQNVIACGEYPLLIDADSLLCPVLTSENNPERWFDDSVLRSGLLPRWNGDDFAANALDSSVLGNIFPKQTNATREWQFINTEGMHLVPKTTIVPAGKNVVILDGKTISPQSYLDEIVSGFEEISQLFIFGSDARNENRRTILLSEVSPLAAFANCKSRLLLRPAITYGAIVNRLLDPQCLQENAEYSVLINRLLQHRIGEAIETSSPSQQQQIFQAEARALQQQDIPYFSISCNGTDLEIDRVATIPNFVRTSSYQQAIAKIQNFDAEHLALQVKLIRSSFAAKYAHLVRNDVALQGELPLTNELSNAELHQEALKIGRNLAAAAIWDGDGCNWIEFLCMFRANRYRLAPLNDSLYTGRAGVSLFLAALAKISGDSQFRKVALAGLDPFCRSIRAGETRSEVLESKFGLLGLGGTIYSMVKMSQFLQESSLLDDAVRAAKLLTIEAIATDSKLDVIWGATGAILGLLPLYQATQDRSILDIAIACGNHLLANRTTTSPRAWVTMEGESTKPLTGFSHGAAGIAMALIRLYGATGDREFLAAAQEGIEYERSVFDETIQNWPDFRMAEQKGDLNYLDVWCHGSAGIGLARLGSLSVFPAPEIRQDIDIALSTSQKNGIFHRGFDHLCCGNVGRIELMVVGSQLLGDLQLLKTARKSIEQMVIASKESSTYGLLPHLPDAAFSPSFYRGAAGIGYQILRTADPALIPSVVIWE
jgi:type 2 lantibiotic biosynthesis protein LanM